MPGPARSVATAEHFDDRRRRDALRPQDRAAIDPLSRRPSRLIIDVFDHRAGDHFHSELGQALGRLIDGGFREARKYALAPSSRKIDVVAGSIRRKLARKVVVAICAIDAANSTPVGPAPNQDECHVPPPLVVVVSGLCYFVGAEYF